jgi:uncharacterized protein YaaQ
MTARITTALLIVALCLVAVCLPNVLQASPVVTGRLDYRLSWNGIPAAHATVNIDEDETGPEPRYRVEATAQTGWLVDLLWSLRARVTSIFTGDDLTPQGFRYDREVNHEHSLTEVTFGASSLATTGKHYHGGHTTVLDVQDAHVLDPITTIFRALAQSVQVGDTMQYEVFTGEARYRVELSVAGEETITVPAGTFKTWRVEPQVWKIGTGLDRRLRRATVWVSQAPVRAVVRIRSEVFIGAVNCDLQRWVAPPNPDKTKAPSTQRRRGAEEGLQRKVARAQ